MAEEIPISSLLSKNGRLGAMWLAAHYMRRLSKDQLLQIKVPSSVAMILEDALPVVPCRILAYLLLGIVKIYSNKVEYLLNDCKDVVAKLRDFWLEERKRGCTESVRRSYGSVTLPSRFELDAFDLGIPENEDLGSIRVKSQKDIRVGGEQEKERSASSSRGKRKMFHSKEDTSEAHLTEYISLRGLLSSHYGVQESMSNSSSHSLTSSLTCLVREIMSSVEDVPDPMVLDEVRSEKEHDRISGEGPVEHLRAEVNKNKRARGDNEKSAVNSSLLSCLDLLHGTRMSLDDRLEPMELDEEEVKQLGGWLSNEEPETVRGSVHCQSSPMNFAKEVPLDCTGSVNHDGSDDREENFPQMPTSESRRSKRTKECPLSITVNATPDSHSAGTGAPAKIAIETPAMKEHWKVQRKQNCLLDSTTTVMNNEVLKNWRADTSNLACRRRRVPHDSLYLWRAQKFSCLPQSFEEPLLPCCLLNIKSRRKTITQNRKRSRMEPPFSCSPECSQQQAPDAPGTPVSCSLSLILQDMQDSRMIEPICSTQSMENGASRVDIWGPDMSLSDEKMSFSGERGDETNDIYSARTRATVKHLHQSFLNMGHVEKKALNLSHVLRGKTRKASAKAFYDILVLKTGDCIDVRQDNAYDDITVEEKSKLQSTFKFEECDSEA